MTEYKDAASRPEMNAQSSADLFEANTHSFVLRIWREETQVANGETLWRGHITHVLSGQRRYFQRLSDVIGFITDYLLPRNKAMDARLSFLGRLQRWLCQRLHCANKGES